MNILKFSLTLAIAIAEQVETPEGSKLRMKYDEDTGEVIFEVNVEKGKYFSIGFGTSMYNTDMVIFQGEGSGVVQDLYSTGRFQPSVDSEQDYKHTTRIEGSKYKFKATRKLDTGDSEKDFVIPLDQEIQMMWAECSYSSSLSSQHDKYGFFTVTLDSKGGEAKKGEAMTKREVVFRHGMIMWTCWFVFGFFQIGTQRWFKKESKYNPLLHMIVGIAVTASTLFAAIDLFVRYGLKLSSPHNIVGFIVMCLSILVLLSGFASGISLQKLQNTKKLRVVKKFHRWIAILAFFIGIWACTSGIFKFTSKEDNEYSFLARVSMVLQVAIFLLAEVNYRFRRRGEVELSPQNEPAKTRVMTEAEFEERVAKGEMLYVLDDLVLDLSQYIDQHPGGRYLLESTVGRDVSKFFYGGHALDGNKGLPEAASKTSPQYSHSNIARKVANQFAIGLISPSQESIYTIQEQYEVNAMTKSFRFVSEAPVSGVKKHYDDLSMLGKHYTVVQLEDDGKPFSTQHRAHRRHYTIANCMANGFHQELLKAIDSNQFDIQHLNTDDSTDISLTLKNYGMGLSNRIFTQPTKKFQIKGPMGKGLGVSSSTSGVHFAFAAGTGVLVLIDLVARMILESIGASPKTLHPDFKLVFFASFQSREGSIALNILEGLARLSQNFKLELRISVEKSPRWDLKFIRSKIAQYKKEFETDSIKKIWVCGPPLLEELFEDYLKQICVDEKMNFRTQVDIM